MAVQQGRFVVVALAFAPADTAMDGAALADPPPPLLTDRRTGGARLATKYVFAGARVFALFAPDFVDRIKLVGLGLQFQLKDAAFAHEGSIRQCQCAWR